MYVVLNKNYVFNKKSRKSPYYIYRIHCKKIADTVCIFSTSQFFTFSRLVTLFCLRQKVRRFARVDWKLSSTFKSGFLKGRDFSKQGSERAKGGKFKIFGDELILDILELQMKSKKKGISVISKLILDILNLQMKRKTILTGNCLFKLSKGGDLKK